jgi:hypothetical protein
MTQHQTSRTLVKSAPELWAECSDAASLARHLGAFGEIRITKLEPETAVAWEGAAASGTVKLAPSGWGTRVTLTLTEEGSSVADAPDDVIEAPEPGIDGPEAVIDAPEPVIDWPEDPPAESDDRSVESDDPPAGPLEAVLRGEVEAAPARSGILARLMLRLRRRAPEAAVDAEPAADEPAADEPAAEEPAAEERGRAVHSEPRGAESPIAATAGTETATAESPDPPDERRGENLLAAALDSLGRAHHRPYSRA